MTNGNHIELPPSVARQLDVFRRGLRLAETLVAIFGGLAGIFAAYIILFVSDRVWDTPVWLRILLTVGCLGFAAGWMWFWLTRWGLRQRDHRQLARMIQRYFPKLGDRLLSVVELAHPETRPTGISEALCAAAMRQVAGETEGLDFAKAVPKQQKRRWGIVVVVLAGLAIVAVIVLPVVGVNVWRRLFNPIGATRYTLAKLTGLPDKQIVAYGEPFVIRASLASNSEWTPHLARGRYEQQPAIEAPAVDRSFTFKVPGQTQPGTFTVSAGDALGQTRVEPLYRPELQQLLAVVTLPDYLGYGATTQDVRRGTADLLAESRFALTGKTSRELRFISTGTATGQVTGNRFALPDCAVGTNETATLVWEDVHGLRGKEPFKLKFNTVEDQPPVVDFRNQQRTVVILEEETLALEVVAEDDYGAREISINWKGPGNEANEIPAVKAEQIVAHGSQQQRDLTGKFLFSPRTMKIGPQRLEFRAVANDYRPGRVPVESASYSVIILDKAEHATLVQREFDRLVEKLEELTRNEEAALARNEQLRKDQEKSHSPQDQAERIAEQEQAERRNAAAMQKFQGDLSKLAKEALRNSEINSKAVAKWAELAQYMSKLANSGMPGVADSLEKAQTSPTTSEQAGSLADAVTQQEKVLNQLNDSLKNMNEAGEMLQSGNFLNRLRKMSELEKSVSETMKKLFPQTVGQTIDEMTVSLRIKVRRVGDQQYQAQQGVQTIRDELGYFVGRTKQERYQDVHEEMVRKKAVEELTHLTELLDKKVSQEGIDASGRWAAQLNQWAEMLEPPSKDEEGGDGGGGGAADEAMMEAIMKLMRVQMNEDGLRSQTRALDTRRTDPEYGKRATELSEQQDKLRTDVGEAGKVLKSMKGVPEALEKVDLAMKETTHILARPQTGGEVIAAETEVIELLSDLVAVSSKNSKSNEAGMKAMMEAMQQGEGNGNKPGDSNSSGGMTDRDSVNPDGSPTGSQNDQRRVEKGHAPDLNKVPAEFREALQAYFEKVEKL